MIDRGHALPIIRQAKPLGISRQALFDGADYRDAASAVSASSTTYARGLDVFRKCQGMSSSILLCGWPLRIERCGDIGDGIDVAQPTGKSVDWDV
jgi:hypothetical protein